MLGVIPAVTANKENRVGDKKKETKKGGSAELIIVSAVKSYGRDN